MPEVGGMFEDIPADFSGKAMMTEFSLSQETRIYHDRN
jgi:hypothetical protein